MAKAEWWSKCVALAAYEGVEPSQVVIISNLLFECRGLKFYVATDEEADDLGMPKDREEQGYFICEVSGDDHACWENLLISDYHYEHESIIVECYCNICGRRVIEVFLYEATEDLETGEVLSRR